jgi:hypothetical protein
VPGLDFHQMSHAHVKFSRRPAKPANTTTDNRFTTSLAAVMVQATRYKPHEL